MGKPNAKLPDLFRPRAPKEANPEVLQRIVERVFEGKKDSQIAEDLRLNRATITRYRKHTDFTKLMGDYLRFHISSRMGEIADALMKQIKKGNVGAIGMALKAVGVVDSKAPLDADKGTSLTVIMPGATNYTEQVIEVKDEDREEGDSTNQSLRGEPPDSIS